MVERGKIASPFLRRGLDVREMMAGMMLCLVLAALNFSVRYDVGFLGRFAAFLCLGAALDVAYTFLRDGRLALPGSSTLVTSALLVLSIPARMPPAQVAAGIAVAVLFGKLMIARDALRLNPMLVGRLFMMLAFPDSIQQWGLSGDENDAMTTATPLGLQAAERYAYSPVSTLVGNIGGNWEGIYTILPGAPGEVCPLLALACGAGLYIAGVADWRPAAAFLAAFAVTCAALGMPVAFHVVSGSAIFSAVFIVTDPRSMPGSRFGRLAAGALAGILNAVIRNHGYYPEGIVLAVLAANLLGPTLDRIAFHVRGARLAR